MVYNINSSLIDKICQYSITKNEFCKGNLVKKEIKD